MPLYRPSELRNFLDSLGISPKKVLSQNFLIDGNIVNKILDSSKVEAGDVVLEIGPGPGVLTEALLDKGATVIAVERDDTLASALNRLSHKPGQLHVFAEDIMTFPIEETLAKLNHTQKKVKVIANLPYHLTSAIIAKLIVMQDLISSLTLMVQEEVARRFTAEANTKNYSSFALFLQFYSNPHYAFLVSSRCFYPAPKVASAVVFLELKEPLQSIDTNSFFHMTRTAFQQRRKMLRSSLKELYPTKDIENALISLGYTAESRPEALSLDTFIKFHDLLHVNTKQ